MLHRTPLYDWHVSHGAKMTEFAGWEMPLHYGSILNEHQAVRNRAGIFDICHMSRFRVTGSERDEYLDSLLPLNIKKLQRSQVGYSFFCNDRGGILDDVTIYKSEDYTLVVANASNHDKILEYLKSNRGEFSVEIEDVTESLCMIAFQGPMSVDILQTITLGDLKSMKYYTFSIMQASGARVLVSRTGYTGEDGFEMYCGSMYVRPLWERILAMGKEGGVVPVGLGARDLLRLEAAMPLYGHELDEETTPTEAGLDRFIDFGKRKFIGRTAMSHSSSSEFSRRLVCFQMLDNSIPRADAPILVDGMPIGRATSGAFSPSLKIGIGMGYVDTIKSLPGTKLEVEVHGKPHPAEVVKRPFYRRPKKS